MRKYTYANRQEAEAAAARFSGEADRLRVAVDALLAGQVDATFRKAPYVVRLIGSQRADGGLVLVTFAPKGQRPATEAYRLDSYYAEIGALAVKGIDTEGLHTLLHEAWQTRNALVKGVAP